MRFVYTLMALAFLSGGVVAAQQPAPPDDRGAAETLRTTFVDRVQPFFRKYCSDCHGAETQEGGLELHSLSAAKHDAKVWVKVAEKLTFGEMPPADAEQPAYAQRSAVTGWIKTRLRELGRQPDWEHKLLFPEYGNLLDHDMLFNGSVKSAAYTPSRLWKKSPYIFDSLVLRGIGFRPGRYGRPSQQLAKVKQPFTIEDKAGVKDFAAIQMADSATLGAMLRNAEVIVDKHLSGAMHELDVQLNGPTPDDQLPKDRKGKPIRPRFPDTAEEFRVIVFLKQPPSDKQIDAAVTRMFGLLMERKPSSEELAKYRKLMRECIALGGNAEGLRTTLTAIAVSPPSVFRMELGQGELDGHGRRMLSPANLAFAIAYALTDEKPDDELFKAATSGRLRSQADVAREVTRIWDDDTIEKPRILRFFHEFFGYHRAPQVFKDDARFGRQYDRSDTPEQLVKDADTLVMHFVKRDQDVLAELLTTQQYFVAHDGDNAKAKQVNEALAEFYDYLKDKGWADFAYQTPKEHAAYVRKLHRMFAHPNGNVVKRWMRYLEKCRKNNVTPIPQMSKREFITAYNLDENTFDYPVEQPFVLSKGKRAGILTHPAWLIAHSLNLDNDPVRRGKWIRERLLADNVPELPITVDARIPDEPDRTLRHRFRVTRQEACWRCHVKMNPLGMPFELYDDFGRHRRVETLHAKGKTAPVDASGSLQGAGDRELDGELNDPIELTGRLARSDRVRRSFVRHAFRYWMGCNEMFSDSSTLIAADQAYVEGGGSFRAMVISLLTSDSFLYRKVIGPEHE